MKSLTTLNIYMITHTNLPLAVDLCKDTHVYPYCHYPDCAPHSETSASCVCPVASSNTPRPIYIYRTGQKPYPTVNFYDL